MSAAQIIDELPKLTAAELDAVRRKLAEIFAENSSTTGPRKKKTREEIREAIKNSQMSPLMPWDELRKLTREP